MHMGEAITAAMAGKKLVSSSLPEGSFIYCNEAGELCAKFEGQNTSFVFTPRAQHHIDDWQVKGESKGWASYG